MDRLTTFATARPAVYAHEAGRATGAHVAFLAFVAAVYTSLPHLVPQLAPLAPSQLFIGIAAVALAKSCLLDRRPFRFGAVAGGGALWLFFAIMAASPIWSLAPELSTASAVEYSKYLVAFVVAANVLDTRERVRQALSVIALASLVPAFGAILGYLRGDVVDGRAVWIGVFNNSNFLAFHMVVSVPIALALRDATPAGSLRTLRRAFWLGVVGVCCAAILVSGSRGGALGLGAVLVLWLARNLFRGRIALGGLCAVGIALLMVPGGPWNRADTQKTLSGEVDASAQGRIDAWRAGLRMVEANPAVGVGAGAFVAAYDAYAPGDAGPARTAHNSYVMIASELGVPALLLFGLALAGAFLSLGKRAGSGTAGDASHAIGWEPSRGRGRALDLERGVQTGIFGFVVCSMTGGLTFSWPLYFLLGAAAALAYQKQTELDGRE